MPGAAIAVIAAVITVAVVSPVVVLGLPDALDLIAPSLFPTTR